MTQPYSKSDLLALLDVKIEGVAIDEKRKPELRKAKIPIVTSFLNEDDGFYFYEPTIGESVLLLEKIEEQLGKVDITKDSAIYYDSFWVFYRYFILEKMSNIDINDTLTSSNINELDKFMLEKLGTGFFLSFQRLVNQKKQDSAEESGSTGEPAY